MKWNGRSYRPAFGVPVYPKKQSDIRELMKPLSEKAHKGNVWIPVAQIAMNVPKDEATPVPSPTLTSTPTPTPSASPSPSALPCLTIEITGMPAGFGGRVGTYNAWEGGTTYLEFNEFVGSWQCGGGLSQNSVAYTGTTGQGVIAYDQDYGQWFSYNNQVLGCAASPPSGGVVISSASIEDGGAYYPGTPEDGVTFTYPAGCGAPTPTSTSTPTPTLTSTPTATPTNTPTLTSSSTPTPTPTLTSTPTPSATTPAALLLDTYTGATMAYSLRKLRSAYTGDAVRVRRASDGTETNIGFSGNDFDSAALTSFASGTTATVTTWYDQSGNADNLTQTDSQKQPFIFSGGSITEINSLPTIRQIRTGSGATAKSLTGSTIISNPFTIVATFAQRVDEAQSRVLSGGDRNSLIANRRTNNNTIYTESTVYNNMWGSTGVLQTTFFSRSGTTNTDTVYTDNTALITNTNNNNLAWGTMAVFVGANGEEAQSDVSELIVWSSNQNNNRSGITTDTLTYYGI